MDLLQAQASAANGAREHYLDTFTGDLNIDGIWDDTTYTRIYRVKYKAWRELLAQYAQIIVKNNNGRYSDQFPTNRELWVKLKQHNYNPYEITGSWHTDCAAMVYAIFCCIAHKLENRDDWDEIAETYNSPRINDVVTKTGIFENNTYIPFTRNAVKRGDILWRDGHLGIAINDYQPNATIKINQDYGTERVLANWDPTLDIKIPVYMHMYVRMKSDDTTLGDNTPYIYYRVKTYRHYSTGYKPLTWYIRQQ